MSLKKREYVDGVTVITAENLNAIQDEIIDQSWKIQELQNSTGGGTGNGSGVVTTNPAKIGYVTIFANKWVGTTSPYSQVVTVDGATKNSQVDLTPSVDQLAVFYQKDLAFVTENEDGVVIVYAIGQKPTNDYTIQVTITEVSV